jgi:dihydrofolate reductase
MKPAKRKEPEASRQIRASAFIAASVDGFIARPDGDIDWLTSRGESAGDTGYDAFMADIDALVMGRGTYEKVATFGEWPYPGARVLVLSTTLPAEADERIEVHADLAGLMTALARSGAKHIYVDGGRVIQSFLRAGLLNDITLTVIPVLLGQGIRLFGELAADVPLVHRSTRVLGAGFVQSVYEVSASQQASDLNRELAGSE